MPHSRSGKEIKPGMLIIANEGARGCYPGKIGIVLTVNPGETCNGSLLQLAVAVAPGVTIPASAVGSHYFSTKDAEVIDTGELLGVAPAAGTQVSA